MTCAGTARPSTAAQEPPVAPRTSNGSDRAGRTGRGPPPMPRPPRPGPGGRARRRAAATARCPPPARTSRTDRVPATGGVAAGPTRVDKAVSDLSRPRKGRATTDLLPATDYSWATTNIRMHTPGTRRRGQQADATVPSPPGPAIVANGRRNRDPQSALLRCGRHRMGPREGRSEMTAHLGNDEASPLVVHVIPSPRGRGAQRAARLLVDRLDEPGMSATDCSASSTGRPRWRSTWPSSIPRAATPPRVPAARRPPTSQGSRPTRSGRGGGPRR